MSNLKLVRRLAARILKVGESRIWIDPEEVERASMAISREDVKRLIHDGVITKRPASTPSRGRARIRKERKKRGRRRGPGSRKGPRFDEKDLWVSRIRAQRKFLRTLKEKGVISRKTYRKLYALAKGGMFRSVSHLRLYLQEHGLLKSGEEDGSRT